MEPMPITEHTRVSATVQATPAVCFEVATDLASYPDWVPAIASVHVDGRDDQGRPVEAAFTAEAMGRQLNYSLRYEYEGAPSRFGWRQVSGDLTRRLDGAYTFEASPDDPGATLVTYELQVELAVSLPGFVKRRAEGKVLTAALDKFKARAESR